jgi:hypothetical protein
MATKSIGKPAKASKKGEASSSGGRGREATEARDSKTKATAKPRTKAAGHASVPDRKSKAGVSKTAKSPGPHHEKDGHPRKRVGTTATRSRKAESNGHAQPTAKPRTKREGNGAATRREPQRKSAAGSRHRGTGVSPSQITSAMHRALESHATSHLLGHVTRDARFDWGDVENQELHPDLAFVSFDRWAAYRHVPTALTWHVVPDLVVEILDETEKTAEIGPRLRDYFRAGVNRIWVVDPRDLRVFDYQSATEYETLGRNDRLSGGRILPGFELTIGELGKAWE